MKKRGVEADLNRLYKQINKTYKSITRELVHSIITKFDDFADVYINNSKLLNQKEKDALDEKLLTRKILNNEGCDEANTISTIINFILNMFIFMNIYESEEPERLFKGWGVCDWMITQIRTATLPGVKNNPSFNDENIIKTFNKFIDISDNDVLKLIQ
mgnify:FL=1